MKQKTLCPEPGGKDHTPTSTHPEGKIYFQSIWHQQDRKEGYNSIQQVKAALF